MDLDRPNAVRMYDYYLGGTGNWAMDRALGDRVLAEVPFAPLIARANLEFLERVVRFCLRNGVDQFLDVGSGGPTVGTVHRIAHSLDPASRCVYVDREHVAVAHGQLMLEREGDPSRHAIVRADQRDPDAVWRAAMGTGVLDRTRPIGLIFCAALHFIPNDEPAGEIVAAYRARLPVGSYLAISHATYDDLDVPADYAASIRAAFALYEKSGTPAFSRRYDEIASFFGDFEMVEPGVVWLPQWRLAEAPSPVTQNFVARPSMSIGWCGVGRKR
ncbi:methyltransferase [Amycolatopsis sp. KNN50.9b]|nr:methyltransferase [Amycolatopsis sp. KNN50.9b]